MEHVRIHQEPPLHNPSLIAAWPGIGQVALGVVAYLREQLGAVGFAQIDPHPYFELGGVFIEENLIQPSRFPESKFYYWQSPGPGGDLVLFLGDAQPSWRAHDFARLVLDVAQKYGVGRVFTLAAALVSELPERPRVWGAASAPALAQELQGYGAVLKGDFFVAGMNGLLLAVARERGLETICLLGETPRFAPQIENPAASLAVAEVLVKVLGLEVDLGGLQELARRSRQELEKFLMKTRQEFLDRFTVPIWERGDEEERAQN